MNQEALPAGTIDAYIAGFPDPVRARLAALRRTIHQAAPGAQEVISYRIPAFKLDGRVLVYFAAYERHIGLYPVAADTPGLRQALAPYVSGKATLRFPLDQPLPLALIGDVVKRKLVQRRTVAPRRAGS